MAMGDGQPPFIHSFVHILVDELLTNVVIRLFMKVDDVDELMHNLLISFP